MALLLACGGDSTPPLPSAAERSPAVSSATPAATPGAAATAAPPTATPGTPVATASPARFRFDFGESLPQPERDVIVGGLRRIEEALRAYGLPGVPAVDVYAHTEADDLARAFDRPGGRPPEYLEQQLEHHAAQARHRAILVNVSSPNWQTATDVQRLRILAHEYVHLLQFELMGRETSEAMLWTPPTRVHPGGPAWFFEGLAELIARQLVADVGLADHAEWLAGQRQLVAARPLSLLRLETYLDFAVEGEYALAHGVLAAGMLLERASLEDALGLWAAIGSGSSWEAAFFGAFGLAPVQFNGEFEMARTRGFN